MRRTASGLWVAPSFSILRLRKRERTVTLPSGERAKVTIDDSGTVKQVEHGDHLDAVVRPAPIRMRLVVAPSASMVGGFGRPSVIRTRSIVKGPT